MSFIIYQLFNLEQYLVEGKIAVKAVISGKKRKIHQVYIDRNKKDRDTNYIKSLCKAHHIPLKFTTREEIDKLASGSTHGGVIATCGEREYQDLNKVLKQKNIFLALVEGVEDPYNFGDICRSLYAAGCDGILLPKRNWTSAVTTITKASAGASELINMYVCEDFKDTMATLKNNHVQICCAMREDAISLYDYQFPNRFVICIGGALRGLSSSILTSSDQNIYIPYGTNFKNALSSCSSTSVFAFEILRQNLKK